VLVIVVGCIVLSVPAHAQEPKPRAFIDGKVEEITSVAFSSDGKTLAAGTFAGPTILWDIATGKRLAVLKIENPDERITAESLAFSPDGATLAAGGFGNHIMFWNVATGKRKTISSQNFCGFPRLVFSPNGKTLASGGMLPIQLWDAATGKNIATLKIHGDCLFGGAIAFTPDSKTLVSADRRDGINWSDTATGNQIEGPLKAADKKRIDDLLLVSEPAFGPTALSPDTKLLAAEYSSEGQEYIKLWELTTGKERATLKRRTNRGLSFLFFSRDGKTLAAVSGGAMELWDMTTGKEVATIQAYKKWLDCLAFSPDGKTMASSGDFDGKIKLWDTPTGK